MLGNLRVTNFLRIKCIGSLSRKTEKHDDNLLTRNFVMKTGSIACKRQELDLGITLNGGQSFRWISLGNGAKYRGVFSGHVWTLSQDDDNLNYIVHSSSDNDREIDCSDILKKYLNLDISLEDSMKEWSSCDSHFEKSCSNVSGVRILNQDIVENLFSFICSSNNNIPSGFFLVTDATNKGALQIQEWDPDPMLCCAILCATLKTLPPEGAENTDARPVLPHLVVAISSMVEKMCKYFGKKIRKVDGQQYYNFPTVDSLSKANVESTLRTEGFGYRAGYIAKTAKNLKELGDREWLENLHKSKGATYEKSRELLMELPGIGPKVADCICLMSLGHHEAIPVDTHIFQVARAIYMPHLVKQKTVTPKIHEEVSTYFRKLWGPLAGWAQTVVFCAKINGNETTASQSKKKNTKNSDGNNDTKKKQRKR